MVNADDITVQRDDLAAVYRYVMKHRIDRVSTGDLFGTPGLLPMNLT